MIDQMYDLQFAQLGPSVCTNHGTQHLAFLACFTKNMLSFVSACRSSPSTYLHPPCSITIMAISHCSIRVVTVSSTRGVCPGMALLLCRMLRCARCAAYH